MSQVLAFLPADLRAMGVVGSDRLTFIGLFSALIFVVGAPLVPLWGVWADRYSRKAVIARSAVVETVVFAAVALAREPWQLALSLLLIGLTLGNTGVMLAAIRDVAPPRRLGAILGIFGVSNPVGMALGPAVGGILVDGLGRPLSEVFGLSALLSLGSVVLVTLGTPEVRPSRRPEGRTLQLAYGALRGIVVDPIVRRIFAIYTVAYLANQISQPYLPVQVERVVGTGPGLASGIALVTGTAALVGAATAPLGGLLGDRVGFPPILRLAQILAAVGLAAIPLAGSLPLLAVLALILSGAFATVGAMIFGLLATRVPPERRSATLNLVYLPLYLGGIAGPALGGGVARWGGAGLPFFLGAAVFLAGALGSGTLGSGALGSGALAGEPGPPHTEGGG